MRYNGLPGKRVDPKRAGIIPAALFICKIDNYLRSRNQVRSDPIRDGASRVAIESSLNTNCACAGVTTALRVDLFVTNKKRTGPIDPMLSAGLQDHSRRRFAPTGMLAGNIGTKISCLNQIRSELTKHLLLDREILVHRDKSAS